MAWLCVAQLAVRLLPFRYWRASLGHLVGETGLPGMGDDPAGVGAARIATHIERGAARLPFATKCLPRAMALCWLLRRFRIAYVLKIAARPASARQVDRAAQGDLHAWVESGGYTVLGELPGPWLVVLTLRG